MGKIIAIANQKGGVGKTTCTYNIGACLAQHGKQVLMIDWDYQASLTMCCGYRIVHPINDPDQDITVFDGDVAQLLLEPQGSDILNFCYKISDLKDYYDQHPRQVSIYDSLDLMPGSPELTIYETGIQMPNKSNLKQNIDTLRDYYDYILIDCTPSLGPTLTAALEITDYVIIPVQPEALDASGLTFLRETIESVKHKNTDIKVLGIILNRYRSAVKHHYEYLIQFSHIPDWPLLGLLRESSYVTRALSMEGKGIPCVVDSASSQPTNEINEITKKVLEAVQE